MDNQNRFFEELSRVAGGAMGALSGFKAEFETLVRQQAERWFATLDLVPRDEFEAVRDMAGDNRDGHDYLGAAFAAKARLEQEVLTERVAALEARLAECEANKPARKTKPKAED